MERRKEFAAANLQAGSYLEREHNARWAALGVARATSGITASGLTLLLPRGILARDQLNPYLQGAQAKEVEQWQSGADHNVRPPKNAIKLSDLENLLPEKLAFAPPEQRDQTCPVVAQRVTTWSPKAPEYADYIAEMKLLSDPRPRRSAEDNLFDYLDPEERRIYNDLARRI